MKTTMNILEQHISWASKVMMEGNSNVAIPEVTFFIVCFNIRITEYKDILVSYWNFLSYQYLKFLLTSWTKWYE